VLIKDRILMRCNQKLHEIFGWSAGGMVGKPTSIWYPDETANALGGSSEIYDTIWRGEAHRREQQLMRNDGSLFWARLTGNAVDISDRSKGTVWTIEDITAERAAALEMKRARALAEDAARIKSDFLANMSHEIRTPMNAITGMAHLALRTDLNPRQRDYLKKIQSSSRHLLGIINDILDISKIEAGKMTLEHIDFELEAVLSNVNSLIVEKTSAKGLELIVDVADDVPANLIGDPLRLGQILLNYANNAVKFTDHGEIAIRVRLLLDTDNDVLLHFAVRDTGIGLSEEQRGRLFRSFEQADASITRKYGGTGLGLAISQQLAELMGGKVGVDSELGIGSTFWFTARLGRGTAPHRLLRPEPDLRGRRMLVVDDNDYAREIIGDMLRSMSFLVGTASSGHAAVTEIARAAAAGEPYEVVFLDWQMPDMDGITTAGEIRRLALQHPPRLAMITGYGREEVTDAAQQAGIEAVLIKPVSASLLFDSVMRILGGEQAKQPRRRQPVVAEADLGAIAGASILLVEDNDFNQEVATELLRQAGFVVDVADNGAIALEMVRQQSPAAGYDIVLMDMQMPVMDGLTATRELRKLPQCLELPIVAMTANAMEGDRERCIAAGMNDHVTKPIDPDQLSATLLHWIKPRHVVADVSSATTLPNDPEPPPNPSLAALKTIAELDVDTGLRHALGREALYVSLLRKLVSGQRDFSARLATALDSGDPATAERLAHTLKGLAAQVGAGPLRDIAEQIELGVRRSESATALAALQAELAPRLMTLIDAIAARLPKEQALPVAAIDPEQLRHTCKQLAQLLANDDFASQQLLEAHGPLLQVALGDDFRELAAAVDNFDFVAALDCLRKAALKHQINL